MKIWKNNILGINKRNLSYIFENDKQARILANNKLKTKHYFSVRGVPVPKLYGIFKTQEEVNKFDFASLPNNVVIKPNNGSLGRGIIPFKQKDGTTFISTSDKRYTIKELKNHIINIVQGKYSESNSDTAFFEQRIKNSPLLESISYKGLPDMRIVCYNSIPCMAMLRVPTKLSDGRANLAENALGVGINLSNGEPNYYYYKGKITKENPVSQETLKKVPNFVQVLQVAVKCAQLSNLKLIGCDIAFNEKNEPTLIEINSRPGLKIQLANKAGLKDRIQKIEKLKPKSINESVEIAMSIFGESYKKIELAKPKVISLNEKIKIFNKQKVIIANANINLSNKQNFIDEKLLKKLDLKDSKKYNLKIKLKKESQNLIFYKSKLADSDILLGKNAVSGYLIDPKPNKKLKLPKFNFERKVPFMTSSHNYGQIDHKIYKINAQLGFNKKLTPINTQEEIEKFNKDHSYNPEFKYDDHTDLTYAIDNQLDTIKVPDTKIGKIFSDKISEIKKMTTCLKYLGTPDFTHYYQKIIPVASESELLKAKLFSENKSKDKKEIEPIIAHKDFVNIINESINKYNLNFSVEVDKNSLSRMKVTSKGKIVINNTKGLTEEQIRKLIAHEVETHALTYQNGAQQPYKIFHYGFANYIELQEGLAVYNQEKFKTRNQGTYSAGNFIANQIVLENSFAESYQILQAKEIFKNPLSFIVRSKKGLSETKFKGGNTKALIYFRGGTKVRELIEKDPNIVHTMYLGKVNFQSLELLKTADFINKRIQIPDFLINKDESPKE